MKEYEQIKELLYKFSNLGVEYVSNGAVLIGRAPFIAPEAWLNKLFPVLSNDKIVYLEDNIHRYLPQSYKDFLQFFSNGLHILNTTLFLDGYRYNYARNLIDVWQPFDIIVSNTYERPDNATDEMIFIGGYGWDCSNLYMIGNGEVYYCGRDDATPLKKWDSLTELLLTEIPRLYNLCDEKGKRLNISIPTTPVVINE